MRRAAWCEDMANAELNDDFRDMLDALAGAKVEFLVVGAHALAVHGVVRATGDLDIFVRPTRENGERLMTALRAFGAPVIAHGVSAPDFEQPDNVYQIGLPPRRIDLLTGITGVAFEDAIGRDALLRNKRATGRDKDRVDADLLEQQHLRQP